MSGDQRVARARRCSDPSPTVSKQLFGTAVKCARPTCNELLYRLENGQPALNCRIAHIRASAPNGPRADPLMTCAEVNAFDNLLLLCLYDAALIDDSWEEYPTEMLFEWKRQQVEQAALLGVAREPTDDEITQLIIESRQLDPLARSASIDLARAVRRLRSAAERTRVEPERILQERQQAISQLNREFLAIDSETGERLQASLSRQEERRYRSRIDEALSHTSVAVEAAAETVLAEAAGVAAATGSACADARAWVERSVGDVVRAASEWSDDLGSALAELDAAAAGLSEVAAGRTVAVPPAPSPAEPEEPSALEVFFGRCREVHERAVRHARVDHLPFDAALHAEVLSLAGDSASVPAVLSLLEFGSDHNASLAAAILKNADDQQFEHALGAAAALQPETAAAHHLRHLHLLADERCWPERLALVQNALRTLGTTIIKACSTQSFWERNIEHGSLVLRAAEVTHGAEMVAATIREALTDPDLVEPILVALSETVEEHDSSTMEFVGIKRRYSEPRGPFEGLPSFIPFDAVCAAIAQRWPTGPSTRGSEPELLATEFLQHRCAE